MQINIQRLQENIQKLASFGMNSQGGIDRSIGSQADIEARKWLIQQSKNLGATVKIDGIANIYMNLEGNQKLKPLVIGSHHDAVPNGGKYDGALGVLLGIEIMECLVENKVQLKHPFQVLSFTAEEPNPFGISTMGSRSITGKLSLKELEQAYHNENKMKLSEAITKVGGDFHLLEKQQLSDQDMAAFIECHIEQSRNLYDNQLSVAVVSKITGIYREVIKITGEANHAGTTKMGYRHDALLAAAEMTLEIENIVLKYKRPDITGTVGILDVQPGAANIIPGISEFVVDFRIPDKTVQKEISDKLTQVAYKIEQSRGVCIDRTVLLDQASVEMDQEIMQTLASSISRMQPNKSEKKLKEQGIQIMGQSPILVSMAGHDAVHMSTITKTGMLFVQSILGKSHCPQEDTQIKDIQVAGNVLLQTILELDKELLDD